ncbi:Sel1-like [Thalictrum thalictroides]|uniref:Sel1-like n=1 Tax=Thalictrum thalictroides TaxID=46969 RepID=A0A7J6VTF9_THATH|nr:Sel1-like [Thalictrum thalictroides]
MWFLTARRWFQDTLKKAKAGDSSMQNLVGQILRCITAAMGFLKIHRRKSFVHKSFKKSTSVWKVTDKPPGYSASGSDSDDLNDKAVT